MTVLNGNSPSQEDIRAIVHDMKYFLKDCYVTEEVYQYILNNGFKLVYDEKQPFYDHATVEMLETIAPYYRQVELDSLHPATDYIGKTIRDGYILKSQELFSAFVEEYQAMRHESAYLRDVIVKVFNRVNEDTMDMLLEKVVVGDEEFDGSDNCVASANAKLVMYKDFLANDVYKLIRFMKHDMDKAYSLFKSSIYKSYGEESSDDGDFFEVKLTKEEDFIMAQAMINAYDINAYCRSIMKWAHTGLCGKYRDIQFDGRYECTVEMDPSYVPYYTKDVLLKVSIYDVSYILDSILYHDIERCASLIEETKDFNGMPYEEFVNKINYIRTGDRTYYGRLVLDEYKHTRFGVVLKKYNVEHRKSLDELPFETNLYFNPYLLTDGSYLENVVRVIDEGKNRRCRDLLLVNPQDISLKCLMLSFSDLSAKPYTLSMSEERSYTKL